MIGVLRAQDPHGVSRLKIHLLRLLYLLMAVFLGIDAWSHIATFEGTWDPAGAAAWSIWAAYSLLAVLGLINPLKMLPLVLLEIVYKLIWLVIVALPLWSAGELAGSSAEEMTYNFLWVLLPIIATPWRYAFEAYVRKEGPARNSASADSAGALAPEAGAC